MKEENIGVLSAGERFGFKGFEWIVLDNNVDGGVLAIMTSAWNNEEYSFDDDSCNKAYLQECLIKIDAWMTARGLKLSPKKTQLFKVTQGI